MSDIDTSAWLTLKEVASMLRYRNTASVSTLIKAGEIRALNKSITKNADYLVDPASLQAFIRGRINIPPVQPPPAPPPTALPPGVKRFV